MTRHVLVRRALLAIATAASVLAATACAGSAQPKAGEFCAMMTDSVGLYEGNPVTQMGLPVGQVRRIESHGEAVKVLFTLDETWPMPADVRAVTRSPSILADRVLELVGNYSEGPKLAPNECIPLSRTSTPLSIASVIGSAADFVDGINPDGSTSVADALRGIDEAMSGQGGRTNELLIRASRLLDSPDQAISQMGDITRNIAQLTSMIRDNREPLKQIITDLPEISPKLVTTIHGAMQFLAPFTEIFAIATDIELNLGPVLQNALDGTAEVLRIASPHYKGIANVLNPLPRFISGINGEPAGASSGGLAKRLNNHFFSVLTWRPPLFRIPSHIPGLLACGSMNASAPGTCADIGGQPYMVDVALLQYVLTEAQRR